MRNANSNIFGRRVSSIVPTTPANIMHQNMIKMYANFLFLTILHSPNSDCTCLPGIHDITFLVIQCQHMEQYKLVVHLQGCVNHPAIQAGSLPVSHVANLPGYYKIPNKTQDPLLTAHNFSNVLSTMRT
jgi:hypothetical protein